jgi:Family of unknown function (DUF5330)
MPAFQVFRKIALNLPKTCEKSAAFGAPAFQCCLLASRPSSDFVRCGDFGVRMRFLLKMAFLLGLVLVLLPSGGSGPAPKMSVNSGDAVVAAMAAMEDMRSFCERQAQACTVGGRAAVAIGHRAQAGAKMLYDFLTEQLGPAETGSVKRGSVEAAASTPPQPSQQTLTPTDLAAPWRGPQPPRAGERPT